MQQLTPPEALLPMIQQAAWLMSSHPAIQSAWHGRTGLNESYAVNWPSQERLEVWRSGVGDSPILILDNIHVSNYAGVSWTEEEAISGGEEQHSLLDTNGYIVLDEGASVTQGFTYSFTKTTSLLEASKTALTVGVMGRLGNFSTPAAAELTHKVEQEFSKQIGQTTTETNSVSDTITISEAGKWDVQAVRGISRARRRVMSPPMIDCNITVLYGFGYKAYQRNLYFANIAEFNQSISGKAPDDVGRGPDFSFSEYARGIGQIGSELNPRLTTLDEVVEYSKVFSPTIRVVRVGD